MIYLRYSLIKSSPAAPNGLQSQNSSLNPLSIRGRGGSVPDFSGLQTQLNQMGLYITDMEPDGNCMFRAVSEQLETSELNHPIYRAIAVTYLRQHKEIFAHFLLKDQQIDDYILKISEDGGWGDYFELVALCDSLNLEFCFTL